MKLRTRTAAAAMAAGLVRRSRRPVMVVGQGELF